MYIDGKEGVNVILFSVVSGKPTGERYLRRIMMKKIVGIVCAVLCAAMLFGCSKVTEKASEDVKEPVVSETQEEVSTILEGSDDLYEKIAADIRALASNPNAKFDYAPYCVVKSIDKDAKTGENVVKVVITYELGEKVFPRIISYINKNSGDYQVAMEEEPENVKNVKVILLNKSDASFVATRAAIHDEEDGTYLITYYGMGES